MAVDTNWQRICKLTIDHTKVNGDLTDFPVLITSATVPSEIFSLAKSDGSDIRFASTSAGTTEYATEIVSFSANKCEIWVKISNISSSVDTDFFIFYKNAAASMPAATATYGKNNVWDSNYKFVDHLGSTLGDSTSNNLTASDNSTTYNTSSTGYIKFGQGTRFFNGSSSYIDYGNNVNINGDVDITIEAFWIEPFPIKTSNYSDIIGKGDSQYVIQHAAGGTFFCYPGVTIYDGSYNTQNGPQINNDTWVHSVGRRKASDNSINYFSNGSNNTGASSNSINSTSYSLRVGGNSQTAAHEYGGYIEEVRISDIARTDQWIITSWNNMDNVSTFITEGTPFDNGTTPTPGAYKNYDHSTFRGTFRGIGKGIL